MSGVVKYRDVETALRRGGAKMRHGTGSHRIWIFPTPEQPEGLEYAIPEKREISRHYVDKLRKLWHLTEADGVSDKDFWKGRWGKGTGDQAETGG